MLFRSLIFLCVGNDPSNGAAVAGVLKKIRLSEHDLFLRRIGEKFRQGRPQRLENIRERRNRWTGQVSLQLREKAFGQLTAGSKFFQRQFLLDAHSFDLGTDFHTGPEIPARDLLLVFFINTKLFIAVYKTTDTIIHLFFWLAIDFFMVVKK